MTAPNNKSMFEMYSFGRVAENKELGSSDVEVFPIENTQMADGEITSNASEMKTKGTTNDGKAYSVSVQSTLSVKATWLKISEPNRKTAPDVRRGERVMLYRYADTDKYYWTTCLDDQSLRKLETAVYAWNGTQDESQGTDSTNSYFFEVSTHQNLVHFHTSKSNGEPYAYDIQINAKDGVIQIQDDIGNFIYFNSKEHEIMLQNADSSLLDINKKNITLQCAETINMTCKDLKVNASNSITEKTQTAMLTATQNTITAITTHNGNINLNGNLGTAAGNGGSGQVTIGGTATFEKPVTMQQTLTAQQVTSQENIVAPNV